MDEKTKIAIVGLISIILGIITIILSYNIELPTGAQIDVPLIRIIWIFVWALALVSIGCGLITMALRKYMPIAIAGLITGLIGMVLAYMVG